MSRAVGRRGTVAVLVAGLLLLLGACVREVRREPVVVPPGEQPAVSLTLRSDRAEYAPGAPVQLILEMVNRGRVPVSMLAPTSQLYDFAVQRAGTELWRWSEGKHFMTVVTEVVLGPGQTGTYRIVWDGRDRTGRPLEPGQYVVTGVWAGGQQMGLQPLHLPLIVR